MGRAEEIRELYEELRANIQENIHVETKEIVGWEPITVSKNNPPLPGLEEYDGAGDPLSHLAKQMFTSDVLDKFKEINGLPKQVGGNHYATMAISPTEYILANNIGWLEGNVVKYVSRHENKNGEEDIDKAIHYLELIKEKYYGKSK